MRRKGVLAAGGLALSALALSTAAPGAQEEKKAEPRAKVSEVRHYPDRYKRRRVRFTPDARPSAQRVKEIIGLESRRWGISAAGLSRRVSCESGFRWWASNGSYNGLGQFAYSTFVRGLGTMPRKVIVKRSRIAKRPTAVVTRFSERLSPRRRSYQVRVRRTRIYVGWIKPSYLHGWAQLRIMSQAIAGRSAVNDSEWACAR